LRAIRRENIAKRRKDRGVGHGAVYPKRERPPARVAPGDVVLSTESCFESLLLAA
jgi:hypothetical protein